MSNILSTGFRYTTLNELVKQPVILSNSSGSTGCTKLVLPECGSQILVAMAELYIS